MAQFPVISYEEDGPVGSYLTLRFLNNLVLCGQFVFYIKANSGKETFENALSGSSRWYREYGPPLQTTDDFLRHEVFLVPSGSFSLDHKVMAGCPRLYHGREAHLPKGIALFTREESYREAMTVLHQKEFYGTPSFTRVNDSTLEAVPGPVAEIQGAARVYVDGFGWRFLIPSSGGSQEALEKLRATTDLDDWKWIKGQSAAELTEYQRNLLLEHFGRADFGADVAAFCQGTAR